MFSPILGHCPHTGLVRVALLLELSPHLTLGSRHVDAWLNAYIIGVD
jgi:hypothetical protein